jgi:SPP1 gp7 family putative phage head morphogenesis protein
MGAARKRFKLLKGLIWETVAKNNALYLGPRGIATFAKAARQYDWPSDPAGKADAFMDWLMGAVDDEILEIEQRDGRRIVLSSRWQDVYVRAAYARGVDQASAALHTAGMEIPPYGYAGVFNKPIHADTLAILYTRNFSDLNGITEAMGQQISRTLGTGLAQGLGPREMAQILNGRVDAIGINRALTLARTEVIHAHAEATLNRYEEFGLDAVNGLAEFSTSGDGQVCDLCRPLDGKTFTIVEARGMLPKHPNCRCTWLPVL